MKQNMRGPGNPDSEDDMINKYGTYEVQRTNGTANDYPQIAQGLSREERMRLKEEKERWYHKETRFSP